jgi:CHAT domain-containing protein
MLSVHSIGIGVLSALLAAEPASTTEPSFDECLRVVSTGPDSFRPYLCLGTPGLPDHTVDVRAALADVLRRKPREPHARVYLALMDNYAEKRPPTTEFSEPLATFERRGASMDVVLTRLALAERLCSSGSTWEEALGARSLLESAERLAETLDDPNLLRLARVAVLRGSWMVSRSESKKVEARLGPIPANLPAWLALLEVSTRALLASASGDDLRALELYTWLAKISSPGTVTHVAATAGLATVTAQLAWQGLASRDDAERLLRESLAEQKARSAGDYNSSQFGPTSTAETLALLLGRNEETIPLVNEAQRSPLAIEFLLQGTTENRAKALSYARDLTDGPGLLPAQYLVARSHAEFWAGVPKNAIHWGQRSLRGFDRFRERESIEEIRLNGDALVALPYQLFISDLLETDPKDAEHLELALQFSERLRSRILLEKLLQRRGWFASAPSERSLTEIQSELGRDEAIVSFMVWRPNPTLVYPYVRGHSWALVITHNRISAVRIAQGEFLEPAVKAWTQQVDGRVSNSQTGASRLYREVMAPVLSELPPTVHSLIVVPDGPLHRLPFDALSETGGPPYLANQYRIALVPSVTVWLELRQRTRLPPGLALAFANTPDGPAARVAEMRGEVRPGQLGVLVHAREEATEAVNAFPIGSALFAGVDATLDRLTPDALRRASLVHFAAHGVLDPQHPDESFLLLAPGAAGSGMLKLADVPRFDWSGKTIVLSACETSAGAFRVGEGVLSLARGFFAGGATAVIGTLSRVRDDEQYELVKRFYRELRAGASVADALTAAKRSLISQGAPPAAWANVVLLGDGTIRPLGTLPAQTSPWRHPELAVAFLIGTVLGAFSLVRFRRRGRGAPNFSD